jgi:dTDP-4-dehydrorhamnose 3,5-epimerase
MQFIRTELPGVVVVEPKRFEDDRGFFMEVFNRDRFAAAGMPDTFVQDNHSLSRRGVLRGLHYQYPLWQGKLVRTVTGSVFDVAVDIRRDSPHRGKWFGIELSAENGRQLYIPPGFAHGFCVTSEVAEVTYKCTAVYRGSDDAGIRWDDPDIGISWPVSDPLVSDKDASAPLLRDIDIA